MAYPFATRFYNSARWHACRKAYIAKRMMIDGGLCEKCGERAGYIVHHKVMLTEKNISNPNIALNHNLLMYVCKVCHDKFEGHGVEKSKPLMCRFGEDGHPLPP